MLFVLTSVMRLSLFYGGPACRIVARRFIRPGESSLLQAYSMLCPVLCRYCMALPHEVIVMERFWSGYVTTAEYGGARHT